MTLEKNEDQSRHPQSKGNRESRRWQRLPIAIPMFVRGITEQGTSFVEFTSAFNINRGGLLLASPKDLPPIGFYNLEIPSSKVPWPEGEAHFIRCMRARVVYSAPANGCRLYGLEFTSPLPESPIQLGDDSTNDPNNAV